ncbi:Holliday junction branch migration protein RuvA [Kiloniella sp. b19]|uniref:Holliday junction branch migration protein RuvA n=1 Tax=Kiloniella sp. GXU_MW_B19 TaxID=3141326 RepID=UPI0031D48F10
MIGKLKGLVDSSGDDWVLLDVNGVGYIVHCSSRTLGALPSQGEATSLMIETHVREDQITLYGFSSASEKDCYSLLCTVQGVGAKMGLAILSALSPQEIVMAIAAQDKTSLTRASGVGPKLAQRILNELKDKTAGLSLGEGAVLSGRDGVPAEAGSPSQAAAVPEDAVSALTNLGYRRSEAYNAVSKMALELGPDATVEDLIKAGLKELMP